MNPYTELPTAALLKRLQDLRQKFKGSFMRNDDVDACMAVYAELKRRGVDPDKEGR